MARGKKYSNRKRCPNFTTQEKLKIIEIVSQFKQIIKNKLTSGECMRAKRKAWTQISRIYNAETWTFNRSAEQLKLCYESICKDSTQKHHQEMSGSITLKQEDEVVNYEHDEYECILNVSQPNTVYSSIKTETTDSNIDLDLAKIIPCQNGNSPSSSSSQQEETNTTEVDTVFADRPDRYTSYTESYHQQEMRFRQDEHDLDMKIKLQKLENERRICDRLAVETTMLRLESKIITKSLRSWNLKF